MAVAEYKLDIAKSDLVNEISKLNKEIKQMHSLITDKEIEFRARADEH